MSRLGENILALRVRDRLTIKELSQKSQVSETSIRKVEREEYQVWNTNIEKIAMAFGVTYKELRFGEILIEDSLRKNEDSLKNYLEAICIAKGITQSDLARMSGVSRATINKIMNEGCVPTNNTVSKLARTLGFPEDKFQVVIAVEAPEKDNLSKNVRALCSNHLMNLGDLERASGVSSTTITAILAKREGYTPSYATLAKIANVFGITVSFLIFGKVNKVNISEKVARNINALCELHCLNIFELEELANLNHGILNFILKEEINLKGRSIKAIAVVFNVTEEEIYYDDFSIEAQWINRDYVRSNMLELCKERDLTLKELSRKAGLSMRTLVVIAQGIGKPSTKTVRKIAKVFGVMPQRLMNLPKSYSEFNFERKL